MMYIIGAVALTAVTVANVWLGTHDLNLSVASFSFCVLVFHVSNDHA